MQTFGNFEKTDPRVRYHVQLISCQNECVDSNDYYPHIHVDAMSRLESMPKCHDQLMSRCPLDIMSSEKLGVPGKISSCGGFVEFGGGFGKFREVKT